MIINLKYYSNIISFTTVSRAGTDLNDAGVNTDSC